MRVGECDSSDHRDLTGCCWHSQGIVSPHYQALPLQSLHIPTRRLESPWCAQQPLCLWLFLWLREAFPFCLCCNLVLSLAPKTLAAKFHWPIFVFSSSSGLFTSLPKTWVKHESQHLKQMWFSDIKIASHLQERESDLGSFRFTCHDVTLLSHGLVNVQVTWVHVASVETCWIVRLLVSRERTWWTVEMSDRVLDRRPTCRNSQWEGSSCSNLFGKSTSVSWTWATKALRTGSDITGPSAGVVYRLEFALYQFLCISGHRHHVSEQRINKHTTRSVGSSSSSGTWVVNWWKTEESR